MLEDGVKGVIIQRDKKTYAVAPHVPCGVVTSDTLRRIADVSDKYKAKVLKITSAARISIIGLEEGDIENVWHDLQMVPGAATGLCIRSIKACPGTTFCKRGMQDSLSMGMKLDEKYHGLEMPGKLKIGVSGCPNQCAENCIKDIALTGSRNGWKLLVGGNGGGRPRLAKEIVKDLSDDDAMKLIDKILSYYKENAKKNQRVGSMLEKMDFEEFKNEILK